MEEGNITIRRGHLRDVRQINALVRASRIADQDFRCTGPRSYWVAYHGPTLIGCAKICWYRGVTAILEKCIVAEDYRRQGIGTKFVKLRLAEARRRGRRIAALCTMYYSFRHYKKLGFRTCPRAKLPDAVRGFRQFTAKRYMKCAVMIRAL